MMIASELLKQTWDTVLAEAQAAEGFYRRRLNLSCHRPAHGGIHKPANTRYISLDVDAKEVGAVKFQDETRGYKITTGPDESGRADRSVIRIEEVNAVYRDVFAAFCADILDHWCPCSTCKTAVLELSRRLASWKRFFQREASGLTREEYIGLFGELSFLEAALPAWSDARALVDAWQGPVGANQDFLFGPLACEVKTTVANDINRIRITNVRQLDSTGLQSLFLLRLAFDFRQGSGRTLRQLISSLKASLAQVSAEALAIFNDRLLLAGFADSVASEYDSWGFSLRRSDAFSVSDGFPRILESTLVSGILDVSYMLDLSAASEFRTTENLLWSALRGPNA